MPLAQELNILRNNELNNTKIRFFQYLSPRSESRNFRGIVGIDIKNIGTAGSRVYSFIYTRICL